MKRRPGQKLAIRQPQLVRRLRAGSPRDKVAWLFALGALVAIVAVFAFGRGTQFLMPGPLASAHGTIENCGACHTKNGNGKLGWVHGLIAGDPLADSKACLTCHQMPNTALNAHGAPTDLLTQSTARLTRVAAATPAPLSARVQSIAFPTGGTATGGLYCATCHQDHQGADFDLNKVSTAQCNACHVVKLDSFDGNHPKFERYPFERRTRIVYDHNSHFGKHFIEIAKKEPNKTIPATCSACHNTNADRRHMAVAPFSETCATCHLDQITGKTRATGPKGVAFLALPGLDLETLKAKKAAIGEWPEASEADVTPFMKVLLSQDRAGRSLVKRIQKLDLKDLTEATDDDIAAVTKFAWRIKRLYHALVTSKASDVLARLDLSGGVKAGQDLMANLTGSIPREVIAGAQREWLPNLGREIANRKEAPPATPPGRRGASQTPPDFTSPGIVPVAAPGGLAFALPPAAGQRPGIRLAQAVPAQRAADQTDDLLFPDGGAPPARERAAPPEPESAPQPRRDAAEPPAPADAAEAPAPPSAPTAEIESAIDPESWADFGGWYRQDYAIYYRPAGHKDRFMYAWLNLTGLQSPKGLASPAATVFDALTAKDAQGSCTKCHSVDDVPGKGRRVNFSPADAKSKDMRFTRFTHEPHFGVTANRGCLTCHELDKTKPYLKTYEDGNPLSFASNFADAKKEQCQTCHTSSMAGQDCLTCHKYHVKDVVTPLTSTKIPTE